MMPQPAIHYQPFHRPRLVQQPARVAKTLARAEELCRANGVRLTPIRRRVLEALHRAQRPVGAYDLADSLAPHGRRIAPITIYRALDFLIEQGLAHRLASLNAYIASDHASRDCGPTAFLICESCGDVNEAASPEFSDALSKLQDGLMFTPSMGILEITGRCAHC